MKKIYKPKEFSELINKSVNTLQRWDRTGILIAHRTPTNRRYYTLEDYNKVMGIEVTQNQVYEVIIYARVSNNNQKDDLQNQIKFLRDYANAKGYIVSEVITDIGSGINYKKEGLLKMINLVECGEVDRIIVLYKDRLIRFGYDLIEYICKLNDTKIEIVDNSTISKEQELTEDLIQIITVFSNKLYGARSKKTINLIKSVKENADR